MENIVKKEYTLKTLFKELTEGISESFIMVNDSCFKIATIKAAMVNLCTTDKDKVLSQEATDFILKEYGDELDKFLEKTKQNRNVSNSSIDALVDHNSDWYFNKTK
jgi:hypothetical protein